MGNILQQLNPKVDKKPVGMDTTKPQLDSSKKKSENNRKEIALKKANTH